MKHVILRVEFDIYDEDDGMPEMIKNDILRDLQYNDIDEIENPEVTIESVK